MPDSNLTPEENLLRIIETPGGKPARGGRGMGRGRGGTDIKLQWRALKQRLLSKAQKLLTLRTVNTILLSAGGLVTLFLVVDFWIGLPKSDFIDKLEEEARATDFGELSIGTLSPLSVYVQEIKGRNMFALSAPVPKGPPEPTAEETKNLAIQSALQDLITNYKVVGIIWSETPQAIIEDVSAGHTFMVNRGSMVKVARVKDILKDRVILSYDDKDIELR